MIGTRIRFVATVVALTLLAAACTDNGVVVTSSIGDDGVAPAVAPPPDAIAPVLHRAGPPGDSLVGAPSSMGAFAIAAEPVYRLELWDGDRVLDIFEPNEPATQVATAWDWAPQTPGLHGLTLRAFDVEGGVATSFPVWVRVSEPKTPGLTGGAGPVFAGVGALDVVSEPLSSVSIDPEQCVATFDVAAAEGAQGIAVYAASFGAEGFVPAGLLPPRGGQVSLPVGSSPLLVYSEPFKPARSPGPPTLIDPPPTCAGDGVVGDPVLSDGVLANAKQADRAYLYMSIDDGETWSRVPGADQAFVYPSAGGDFDFTGLLPPVEPGQSASFEAWGWVDGDLTPLGRGSFAPPGDGDWGTELVYQPYAGPVVASSDLDWVVGTPDVLVRSGTICTYDPPPPPSSTTSTVPVSVSGETTSPSTSASPGLVIGIYPDNCANAPIGSYSKLFRWKPLIGGSEGGIVQVSTKPFPSGPILSFPGLIHVQSAGENAGGVFEFELPIDDIIDPPPAKSDVPDPAQLSYQDILSLGGGSGTAAAAGEKVTFVPRAVIGGSGMTLHVRVLPMIGGKPGLGGSNEVVIDVDDIPPPGKLKLPPPPPSISLQVSMVPPLVPNPAFARCVRVVENPFGSDNPPPSQTPQWFMSHAQSAPAFSAVPDTWYEGVEKTAFVFENGAQVHKGLVPGAIVCAHQLSPPSKQWWEYIADAIDFAGYVWDLYVTVWDKLKGWVSDVLAQVSGCVTLAEQLGKSKAEAEKICSGFANTAIGVALTAYGVPPTVPKFEQLAAASEGKIKEILVDVAADAGLDCGAFQQECEDMVADLLDELLDEMKTAATQAAVSAATQGSQWVLAIHPGIYVVPEPAGTSPKAIFDLEITRSADPKSPPPPATCVYTAWVTGHKDYYEWQDYKDGTWTGGPVDGEVMKAGQVAVDLTGLAPGETLETAIVLDDLVKWYPPGQNPQWDPTPWNVTSKTWIFLIDYGVTATPTPTTLTTSFTGGPLCGGATQTHPVGHGYAQPWQVPFP